MPNDKENTGAASAGTQADAKRKQAKPPKNPMFPKSKPRKK